MKLKHKLIVAYLAIGILYGAYEHYFGSQPGLPWGTCIGHGLAWPAVLIPGLGKVIGGLLILAFVAFVTLQ